MLAQLQAMDPIHLRDFGIFTVVLLGIGGTIFALVRRSSNARRIEPQPLEIAPVPRLVTREECKIIHADTSRRLAAIEADMAGLRREVKENQETLMAQILREVGKVHDRVNSLQQSIGELTGAIRHLVNGTKR